MSARQRRPRKARGADRVPPELAGLTPAEQAFLAEYESNGQNGTLAYQAVHPKARRGTAAVEAHRTLRKPNVAAALAATRAERFKRLGMKGDEALALVSTTARADIRELFGKGWKLLPPSQWPDSIARCVKGIRPGVAGTAVLLQDALAAQRTILEQTGKIKSPAAELGSTLARILAGKYVEETDEP